MKSPYLSLALICNGRANGQKLIFSLCALFLLGSLSAQVTFFQEDFETDGNGTRYVANNQFIDDDGSSEDYFGRIENVGGVLTYRGCVDDPIDVTNPYTGQSGNFFMAGEDLNDTDGCGEPDGSISQRTVVFTDINIAGASEMTCRILVANGADNACGGSTSRWDQGEGLSVVYSIDDGPITDGLCFSPDLECNVPGDLTNEPLHLDLDCDGDGEDGFLSNEFTEFSFTIPAGGTTLGLAVNISADAGDEEIAFDNIRLEAVTPPVNIVCPNTGTVSFSPVEICEGGSFETCTVSGVENLGIDDNGEANFQLDFFFFEEQTDDPYAGGGEFGGFLNNAALVDGEFTFPTSGFIIDVNRPGFMYTILNPAPADPDCRPFAEFEILVTDLMVQSKFAGTVCEDFTQAVVPAALTPFGGVYSGPGVTDLGDGISYAFDASVNGPGTLLVNYTVTVDGCTGVGFDTIEIVALPEVDLMIGVDTLSIANGAQTGLGGGMPLGGVYAGSGVTDDGNGETFTFDPAAAGVGVFNVTYTVTEDESPNCSNQAIDSIEVVQVSSVTNFAPSDVRVYPNPTSGIMTIKVAARVGSNANYELTDLRGRAVASGRMNGVETQIDLEARAAGLYFLKVYDVDSGHWLVKRIIRQ